MIPSPHVHVVAKGLLIAWGQTHPSEDLRASRMTILRVSTSGPALHDCLTKSGPGQVRWQNRGTGRADRRGSLGVVHRSFALDDRIPPPSTATSRAPIDPVFVLLVSSVALGLSAPFRTGPVYPGPLDFLRKPMASTLPSLCVSGERGAYYCS